jgi:hypothetical protein
MHSTRVGVGEGLVVSRDLFWIKDGYEGRLKVFSPSPDELMQDWELTTTDLIRSEWQKSCEEPF